MQPLAAGGGRLAEIGQPSRPAVTATSISLLWTRSSLSARILIGLGLGIVTGLFLGELAQPLELLSSAYIRLMQMTVVPYMAVALIVGLGQLTLDQARLLASRGLLLLVLFWGIAFVTLFLMPMSLPDLQAASFYSSALIEPKTPFDFVGLYIPANPFHALANNVVPAVVFFSATIGIALIGIENKAALMSGLQTFLEALTRVAKFIVNLTPLGVFAIAAVTAGTMTFEEFARLQAYFVIFVVAALLLAFWILPGLVAAVTPFRYKDVLRVSKDALLTAFLTQNLFIVVPILVECSNALLEQYRARTQDSDKLVDIIIPVTFNFPSVGKLLTLLFIPFTAWMAGSALEPFDYPRLFLVGLASYFAKAQTALPFLMDQFEIPQDLFQLYIPTSIVTGKFDTLVSAVNLMAFSLIGVAALSGSLVFKPARILHYLVVSALALSLGVVATGGLLRMTIDTDFKKGEELLHMRLAEQPLPMRVHRSDSGNPQASAQAGMSGIRQIKQRGRLRVGYVPSRYPFSFFNSADELVGFDVEIANQLARDLGVELEFVPITWGEMGNKLDARVIDLVPTVPYLPALLELVEYSDPVMTATAGFLVKDSRRHDFATLDALKKQRKLRAGIAANPEFVETQLRAWLPDVDLELVQLNSPGDFFASDSQALDALISTAEIGTAFTLLHPEYALVVPEPILWRLPLGFAVAKGNRELSEYLDGWVLGHQQRGSFQRAYNHWILGEGAKRKTPRWSVVRDILHWVD